jgi:hypothetical protein
MRELMKRSNDSLQCVAHLGSVERLIQCLHAMNLGSRLQLLMQKREQRREREGIQLRSPRASSTKQSMELHDVTLQPRGSHPF